MTRFKETACDLIIGAGGWSPMDTAKGFQVLASHPQPLHRYLDLKGDENIIHPMPSLIEIPTTSCFLFR